MLAISTKVELKSKMKNARTIVRLSINTKISCQSFICLDRLGGAWRQCFLIFPMINSIKLVAVLLQILGGRETDFECLKWI
jgi:hypothetical protein